MGCGMLGEGEGYVMFFCMFFGYVQNLNFGGIFLFGLGCEVMQIFEFVGGCKICVDGVLQYMMIQQEGGICCIIECGLEVFRGVVEYVNKVNCELIFVFEIIIGL